MPLRADRILWGNRNLRNEPRGDERHFVLVNQTAPVGRQINGGYYIFINTQKVRCAIRTKGLELYNSRPILLQINAGPYRKSELCEQRTYERP